MVVQVHSLRRSRQPAGARGIRFAPTAPPCLAPAAAPRLAPTAPARLAPAAPGGLALTDPTPGGVLEGSSAEAEIGSEAIAHRILRVMADSSITAVYQPVFELPDQVVVGYEALARFPQPPDYPVSQWFRDAADTGLAVSLELAAIRRALDALPLLPADHWLAINASPQTLSSLQLPALLDGYELGRLVLELTEHAQIADYGHLTARLAPLRAAGARVAIDDVGAGYASFQHVLELKPDIIKLDKALTCGLQSDPVKQALVRALVAFAGEVDALIIGEGVETVEELEALFAQGVTCLQGYHLARPAPLAECGRAVVG